MNRLQRAHRARAVLCLLGAALSVSVSAQSAAPLPTTTTSHSIAFDIARLPAQRVWLKPGRGTMSISLDDMPPSTMISFARPMEPLTLTSPTVFTPGI